MSKLFGDKFKVGLDESWEHSQGDRIKDRKWFEQVLCAKGSFIYLYSENPLTYALYIPRIQKARIIAQEVPEAKLDMLTGEAVIYFPAECFQKVARLAGARKRRKLSEVHKEKLAKSNTSYRFKKKVDDSNLQSEAQG
jgi:hypothetical protein